ATLPSLLLTCLSRIPTPTPTSLRAPSSPTPPPPPNQVELHVFRPRSSGPLPRARAHARSGCMGQRKPVILLSWPETVPDPAALLRFLVHSIQQLAETTPSGPRTHDEMGSSPAPAPPWHNTTATILPLPPPLPA
ncbi:hypothetical protein M758_UG007300, partial [Ceratodon purpureus]